MVEKTAADTKLQKRDYSYLNDPVLDALVAAENALATEDDWWQDDGHMGRNNDVVCIMNALWTIPRTETHVRFAAQEITREIIGIKTYEGITDWNDAPERTFAEVKALQRRAIESRLRLHNIVIALPAKVKQP